MRHHRTGDDRGSLSLELCIASVIFFVLIALVTGLGRMAHARGIVNGIARDAARAASLARTLPTAQADAQSAAQDALGTHSSLCQSLLPCSMMHHHIIDHCTVHVEN